MKFGEVAAVAFVMAVASEGDEKSIPVSLRPQGGKLLVTWDRGALGRCP